MADFDGVLYKVTNAGDGAGGKDVTKILVSLDLTFFHELQQHGVDAVLQRVYGAMLQATPESGCNVTVLVDLAALAGPAAEVVDKVARLKRHCFSAVFIEAFAQQQAGTATETPAILHYRPQETMVVAAARDRVTVVFSTIFQDADDVVLGKVFLQEFKEGRRTAMQAPQVLFAYKDPPRELAGTNALTGDNVGYVTFGPWQACARGGRAGMAPVKHKPHPAGRRRSAVPAAL